MQNQVVPYQVGYDFGVGVDSATGNRRQFGATGAPQPMQGNITGGEGSFSLQQIQTTSDLETHLGISADASGGIGLFSASARFDFARDCKIQSNSITLLLICTKSFAFKQILEPQLDPAAAQLVANGQIDLFTQRYGDCFVGGVESGGQFFGVIRIDVASEADSQTINAALSGSYGPIFGDVKTTLKDAVQKTSSKVSAILYYEGGNVSQDVKTPDDLFLAKDQWESSVLNAARPYAVLLMPWIIANGPNPPNAADLEHQKDVLKTCAKLRSMVMDSLNLLEYMMDPLHINEFQITDLTRLSTAHEGFSQDYEIIMDAASFAIDNAKQAVEPEIFARTVKNMPNYKLTTLPLPLPKRVSGQPSPPSHIINIGVILQAMTQKDWRYCGKCHTMFFDGFPDKGRCPGGGGHQAMGFNFSLPHDIPETSTAQTNWRYCGKCHTMFFDGFPDKGRCPGGGGHQAMGFNFVLPHL